MGGVLSTVIYGLPLEQVNSPFIINSGLRQSINPPWQFAYLLGQPVPPLQQMARGGCDSTAWPHKLPPRFANMSLRGKENPLLKVLSGSCRSRCLRVGSSKDICSPNWKKVTFFDCNILWSPWMTWSVALYWLLSRSLLINTQKFQQIQLPKGVLTQTLELRPPRPSRPF